jgi:hypothetical protein
MPLRFALLVALAACADDFVAPLVHACENRVCPLDPPEYIDCMPVISKDLQPVCSGECREFLANTCGIEFVE